MFLQAEKEDVKESSQRQLRVQRKEQKALVNKLLTSDPNTESHPSTEVNPDQDVPEEVIENVPGTSTESALEKLFRKYNSVVAENSDLKNDLHEKQNEINNLKQKVENLESENANFQKELVKNMDSNVEHILKDFLTPNQISIILRKKKQSSMVQR